MRRSLGNVADVVEVNCLPHGEEADMFGDAGSHDAQKLPHSKKDVTRHVAMRPGKYDELHKHNKSLAARIDRFEHNARPSRDNRVTTA